MYVSENITAEICFQSRISSNFYCNDSVLISSFSVTIHLLWKIDRYMFQSDLRFMCFQLNFKFQKKMKYIGLKEDITAIVIYITILYCWSEKGY